MVSDCCVLTKSTYKLKRKLKIGFHRSEELGPFFSTAFAIASTGFVVVIVINNGNGGFTRSGLLALFLTLILYDLGGVFLDLLHLLVKGVHLADIVLIPVFVVVDISDIKDVLEGVPLDESRFLQLTDEKLGLDLVHIVRRNFAGPDRAGVGTFALDGNTTIGDAVGRGSEPGALGIDKESKGQDAVAALLLVKFDGLVFVLTTVLHRLVGESAKGLFVDSRLASEDLDAGGVAAAEDRRDVGSRDAGLAGLVPFGGELLGTDLHLTQAGHFGLDLAIRAPDTLVRCSSCYGGWGCFGVRFLGRRREVLAQTIIGLFQHLRNLVHRHRSLLLLLLRGGTGARCHACPRGN